MVDRTGRGQGHRPYLDTHLISHRMSVRAGVPHLYYGRFSAISQDQISFSLYRLPYLPIQTSPCLILRHARFEKVFSL